METPIGEEEDSHLGDFIEDDTAIAPDDAADFTMLREQLDEILDTLTSRERKVLELHFGLIDGTPRTLEEVDKEFDVTRERIRQIEAKASPGLGPAVLETGIPSDPARRTGARYENPHSPDFI